jgi:hypothetical protein
MNHVVPALLFGLLLSGTARATPEGTRLPVPTGSARSAVRAAAAVSPFSDLSLGMQWSQRLDAAAGIDVVLARVDMGRGRDGPQAEVLGRYFAFAGRHGISAAVGPSALYVPELGPVLLLQSELAYELRTPGAPTLLAGVGPTVALTNSREAACPETGWLACLFERDRFKAGDVGLRFRLAAGYAF